MNLYLLTQRDDIGYDTFDSMVVCATDEDIARNTNPFTGKPFDDWPTYGWARCPENVAVKLVGIALPDVQPGTVCSSFNAG